MSRKRRIRPEGRGSDRPVSANAEVYQLARLSNLLLNAGEVTRPWLTSLHFCRQGTQGRLRRITRGKAAIGDHVQRLTLMLLLEIVVIRTVGFYKRLSTTLQTRAENLHGITCARLRSIPITTSRRLGRRGRSFRLCWRRCRCDH